MSSNEAYISEIFVSFQGEGPYIGEKQLFIRFAGCNIACNYCDTAESQVIPLNPIKAEELMGQIVPLIKNKNQFHSISITGGEPLLQVEFLKGFLPELKKIGLPIYLETNGTLPAHLEEIIEWVDIVALDFKIPSATGLSPYFKEHTKSLESAYQKEVFVKMAVAKGTKVQELAEAADIIANVDSNIMAVIQPITPHGKNMQTLKYEDLLAFHTTLKRKLKRVRVIPQMHKALGLR